MFCINCGNKLIEGAKFCPNCGTKIVTLQGEEQEKTVLPETAPAEIAARQGEEQEKTVLPETAPAEVSSAQDIGAAVVTEKKGIEDIFSRIFNKRGEFGSKVLLAGKDNIMKEEYIRRHYLHENSSDKLLMVAKRNGKSGFVITDQKIVWDNEEIGGRSEILLENIKSIGYSLMGTNTWGPSITLTDYNNEEYPDLRLWGIPGVDDFAVKLQAFIYTMQKNLHSDLDDDIVAYFITHLFWSSESDGYKLWNPETQRSSEEYQREKHSFHVPDHEDMFFRGSDFALCTSGIYYYTLNWFGLLRGNGDTFGYIPWKEFIVLDIRFNPNLAVAGGLGGGMYIGKEKVGHLLLKYSVMTVQCLQLCLRCYY